MFLGEQGVSGLHQVRCTGAAILKLFHKVLSPYTCLSLDLMPPSHGADQRKGNTGLQLLSARSMLVLVSGPMLSVGARLWDAA